MPIAKETAAPQNPIPAGLHQAVCYAVIDLGTQPPMPGSLYSKEVHKVMLCFEVPGERIKLERDDKQLDLPRATSKEFTLSLHEKASLRHFLVAWRGKQFTLDELAGFDVANVLGANAMLNIIHNERGHAQIASISPLIKGLERKTPENPAVKYDLGDREIPASIPTWIKRKIAQARELQPVATAPATPAPAEPLAPSDDDVLPF